MARKPKSVAHQLQEQMMGKGGEDGHAEKKESKKTFVAVVMPSTEMSQEQKDFDARVDAFEVDALSQLHPDTFTYLVPGWQGQVNTYTRWCEAPDATDQDRALLADAQWRLENVLQAQKIAKERMKK